MAKNFDKAGSSKVFENVAKVEAEKARVITIKMVADSDLYNYPKNYEDIDDTADIENSIRELGFTDPIEATTFGQPEGKYMIVSGHRRRKAGKRSGISIFPCVIKSFSNEIDVHNYVLLSNSQRDSAKDPLLFSKRYKMHEEYLKSREFKGNVREEIAKRLGISVQQADRYSAMNKVIEPVWDMIRRGIVGMSSVLPMATYTLDEQVEIFGMMEKHISLGGALTRETTRSLIDGYKTSKISPSPEEVFQVPSKKKTVDTGKDAAQHLEKLKISIKEADFAANTADAERVVRTMANSFADAFDKMIIISRKHDQIDILKEMLADLMDKLT